MVNLLLKKILHDPTCPTGKALDIGFGSGDDLVALAEHGFEVIGIDASEANVQKIHERVGEKVLVEHSDVRSFLFPKNSFSVIHANNVFPFLAEKKSVHEILEKAIDALVPEGFFVFSLFGPHDAWVEREDMNFFSYDEILNFLNKQPVEIYFQSTEEGWGHTMKGEMKYWHIHRFIVRKNEMLRTKLANF